jgi:hypothetical protein
MKVLSVLSLSLSGAYLVAGHAYVWGIVCVRVLHSEMALTESRQLMAKTKGVVMLYQDMSERFSTTIRSKTSKVQT